jgi:hypothetical protein
VTKRVGERKRERGENGFELFVDLNWLYRVNKSIFFLKTL